MGLIAQLTPVCEITGGGNTAATIQARLVSCTVVDTAGSQSDSINITIDGQGLDEWPRTGQVIGCRMGYKEDGSVVDLGRFKLSRISESLLPNTISLTGTAAPFHVADETELKRRRSRSWSSTTVGAVVRDIAGRHGFSPRVHPDLDGLAVEHMDQTDETDLRFLTRLAGLHDAVCKPVDALLVFSRRGQIKSLSGRVMQPVKVVYPKQNRPGEPSFVKATVTASDKQQFAGVTAQWYDAASATERRIDEGAAPRKRLETTYESEQAARDAIAAELRRIDRQGDQLRLDCPGNPMAAAEGLLELEGFPSGRMVGTWSIDRATHNYGTGGYRCNLEATRPTR